MPLVRINILKGFSADYKKKLTDTIHETLVEVLKIPVHDRKQLICEFEKENFDIYGRKSDKYMIIEIVLFAGRTAQTKKALFSLLTSKLAEILETDPLDILIILGESPLENWGIRGGLQASETDLGFKVDV